MILQAVVNYKFFFHQLNQAEGKLIRDSDDGLLCFQHMHIYLSTLPKKGSVHVAGVAVALDSSHCSHQNLLNLIGADGRNRFQPLRSVQLHLKI